MTMGRTMTFRNRLALIAVAITVLALVVSLALVVLTTLLHRASGVLADAVESVRLTEETEIDLLLHASSHEPVVRDQLQSEILQRLGEAHRYVSTEEEARVLRSAETRVHDYFVSSHAGRPAPHEPAYAMLDELVRINLDQARDARQSAARWNELANLIGLGTVIVLLPLAGSLLWWVRQRAFRPVFALGEAMDRFGRGDRAARAVEEGPAELREMAARFNQMAEMLAAHHDSQISALAGIAHDLRNPLQALSTSVGIVEHDRPLPSEPDIRRSLDLARRQVTRLDRMIADLLEVSKIHAGHLELRLRDLDLRRTVRESVELFGAQRVDIDVSVPEEPVWMRGDPLRIEQVVSNLLSNAIKYSPSGRNVEVRVRREDRSAVIEVIDRGIGISPEDQRRLFEPFRRVGLSQETIPGVGLGLFVVSRIVEGHGGEIEVESQPGRGSCFRVRFAIATPALHGEPARVAGLERVPSPSGRGASLA
jgi:two-component system, OmpR family, sensor histidine kinase MtrB